MADVVGWVIYTHRLGARPCGLVALYVADVVALPRAISGVALKRADGGVVVTDDQRRCTSCGGLLPLPLPMPAGRTQVDV